MKKFSTRFVSTILSLILIISSLPLSVISASAGNNIDDPIVDVEKDYYLAPGDSASGRSVFFSTMKKLSIDDCEYTFSGNADDNSATGTFSASVGSETVYLSVAKAGYPNQKKAETLTLSKGTLGDNTFTIKSNSYLYFWEDGKCSFDRTNIPTANNTNFALFVKDEGSSETNSKGYKRVTSFSEIVSGKKYLITHPSKYNDIGFAADGADWYFLNPTAEDNIYSNVAKLCETTSSYTTEAYCGRGVSFSGNKVQFPEQGFVNLEHCEFTFSGTNDGSVAKGTLSNNSLGYTTYLNLSTSKQPIKTQSQALEIKANTKKVGNAFSVYNEAEKRYLFFCDDEWSTPSYSFDRYGDANNTQTAFSFFVRDDGNKTSGIYGYKRVTSLSEITNGKKFIVAHPGKYNLDGTAKSNSDWYLLFPSKTDNVAEYAVAKVYDSMPYSKAKRLHNGSFEYDQTGAQYNLNGFVLQVPSDKVQTWETSALENKIELFNATSKPHMSASEQAKNYIPDGQNAAELNADEPGSLYQVVNTLPSSTYLWGLDHRGRTGTDTMALVIGPNQSVRPSKNSGSTNQDIGSVTTDFRKAHGKDQFMQMVEWAKSQKGIELLSDYSETSENTGSNTNYKKLQNITVYSKPFDVNGSFQSSDDLSPFSLVPTDEHTEEWHIWIMISGSGDWSHYGSNDKTINGGNNIVNDYGNIYSNVLTDPELKQFFYSVPAGQTESMFAFVPIDTAAQHRGNNTNATCGNLLDNVNFEVFNSFTASSTDHGSGSVSNANKGEDFQGNDDVTKIHPTSIYTHDNSTQNLIARVSKKDLDENVTFAGIYLTVQDEDGNSTTVFKPRKGYEVDESSLTWVDDSNNSNLQTATTTLENGKQVTISRLKHSDGGYSYDIPDDIWLKRIDENTKNALYIFQLKNVVTSTDAHFIFLKSPTVTYDANSDGTEEHQYKISDTDKSNVYTFKPDDSSGTVKYIDPVSSHPPVAPNDGWKFTGWKLFDADGVVKKDGNDIILSGTNAIACNTKNPNGQVSERRFIVVDGKKVEDAFNEGADVTEDSNTVIGKEWTVKDSAKNSIVYEQKSEALSLVAQWRFKNTFIPEYQNTVTDTVFTQGETGGTIELKNKDSENYTAHENGTKSYFAEIEEQVVATAKANQFYTFIGWYDSKGNVVTTNPELIVNQIKGEIGEYHARFQKTGAAVNFYYLEYNESTKSYEYKVYDGGKYTQYLDKNERATKPTGDSKNVKTWFTSPTNLGADTAFDFNKPIPKSIDLYAAPTFTFNYYNYFQFIEPWKMFAYSTLKYDGNYIDMKNDRDVTDYNVYILKADSVDEAMPKASDIKSNPETKVVSKNDSEILFNSTTKTGNSFNRVGTQYNNLSIYDMKKPVWVTFDFTYRGITYTANVKNRSLYNNIQDYKKSTQSDKYYTQYKQEQEEMLTAITNMYDATVDYNIDKVFDYKKSSKLTQEVKTGIANADTNYKFTSSTTIRNIEPWGFKYSFGVDGSAIGDFSDYGVAVLSNYEKAPESIAELLDNENTVVYSKSTDNIYSDANNTANAVAYHIEGIKILDYDKNTYSVFFVKDADGKYHCSSIVSNSYQAIASQDTSSTAGISKAIIDYAEKINAYWKKLDNK